MSPDQRHIRGIVSMILAGLSFSLMVGCVKAVAGRLPISEIVCVRLSVTAAFIAVLMWKEQVPFWGVNRPLLFFRAILGTVSIGLNFYAASLIPLVDHSLILKSSVIFTAMFAVFWLKERPTRGLHLNTLLGLLGVALVVKPTGQVLAFGGLSALLAAVLIGWTGAILRRLLETDHSYTIIAIYCWFAAIFYFVFFWPAFILPTPLEWCFLLGSGVAGTVGQLFFTAAYKYSSAGAVSPFLYSEVVFAALIGGFFFHEIPDILTIMGSIIICFVGVRIALAGPEK